MRCAAPSRCCRRRSCGARAFRSRSAAAALPTSAATSRASTPPTLRGALAGAIAFTLIGIPMLGSRTCAAGACAVAASGCAARCGTSRRALACHAGRADVTVLGSGTVPAFPGTDRVRPLGEFLAFDQDTFCIWRGRDRLGRGHRRHRRRAAISHRRQGRSFRHGHRHAPRAHARAHPGPAAPASAQSVLIVGVGAGVTAGALSIHPEVERIVICEIEPAVPVSARALLRQREPSRLRRSARAAGVRRCARTFCRRRTKNSTSSRRTRFILGFAARRRSTRWNT